MSVAVTRPAELPRLDAYIAEHPGGLRAHPQCRHKAAGLRSYLRGLDLAARADTLPAPLAELVRSPPPVTAWISEVHATAVILAVRDLCFDSDHAALAHSYTTSRALLAGPLYRILFAMISPERVARGANARWKSFHTGSTLRALVRTPEPEARILLSYPNALFPPFVVRAYGEVIRGALDLAIGGGATVAVVDHTPTHATYRAAWPGR